MSSITLHNASAPVYISLLKNLSHCMDKAIAFADTKKIDHKVLLEARLAPDMFDFTKQVQLAVHHAVSCLSGLSGAERPSYPMGPASFAELQERIQTGIRFIESIKPEQVNGNEDKMVSMQFGPRLQERLGLNFLQHFENPHFYFHVNMAYAILRHNGVPVGKMDYIGA